jgi:pimeloyl-ACP methyl ester carboxylesterase
MTVTTSFEFVTYRAAVRRTPPLPSSTATPTRNTECSLLAWSLTTGVTPRCRAEGELLCGVAQIDHIPAVMIHGRLDLRSPPDVPWQLAQAWPAAEPHVVPDARHATGDAISEHVRTALDNFASPLID